MNLRLSRSFGIGPKIESSGNSQQGGGPGGPGGPGGGRGGGGGGGGGPAAVLVQAVSAAEAAAPRGMFGGGATGRKYSLTLQCQALNLFNNIDYGTPSGTVIPTRSDTDANDDAHRATLSASRLSLANGIFASPTSSAARRIFFRRSFRSERAVLIVQV